MESIKIEVPNAIDLSNSKSPKQEILNSTYPQTEEVVDDLSEVEKLIKDAEDIISQSLTLCAAIFPEDERIESSVQKESTHVKVWRSAEKSKPHEESTSVEQSRLVEESGQNAPSRQIEEIRQAESSRSQRPEAIQDAVEIVTPADFPSDFEVLDYALDHARNLLDSYSASEIDIDTLLGTFNTTPESNSSATTNPRNISRDDDDVVFVSAGVASPVISVVDLCTPIIKRNRRRTNQCLTSNSDASVILIDDMSPTPAKQLIQTTLKSQSTPFPKLIASKKVTPTKTPKPDIMCSVCMDSVMNNQPTTTICGHIFCLKCITTTIQLNKKCPLCNRSLNKKNYHRIYF